ncbi:MAG: tetratricopeptide repeat protein [Thermodesulfobacteriota bacterium]
MDKPVHVLIVTAARGEDKAVREVDEGGLGEWEKAKGPKGYPFKVWVRDYETHDGRLMRVAVTRAYEMGASATGNAAARLVDFYKPQCLAMCGVCAGNPERTKLGDVIIADRVYDYDRGEQIRKSPRARIEFHPDMMTHPLKPQWKQAAEGFNIPSDASWLLERPILAKQPPWAIHVGPMATGSKLVRDKGIWDRLRGTQQRICGLDMEASAIGLTGFLQEVPMIVVKGVMDYGEPERKDIFRSFAARAAAEVLIGFLRQHLEPQGDELTGSRLKHGEPKADKSRKDVLSENIYKDVPSAANPATLLNARYQVVPFFDDLRATELKDLEQWCADDKATSVRLFVGAGGSGKTRLFIEWARRMRDRGWFAGFVREELSEEDMEILLTPWKPCLVVIDYAESRPRLSDFLIRVAERSSNGGQPLRVALLAREIADWWNALQESNDALRHLLSEHLPTRLETVPMEGPLRLEVWKQAANAFADKLVKRTPEDEPDLNNDLFGRPLYLHMAALAAVEELDITANGLLNDIVAHEKRVWSKQFPHSPDFLPRASRMVATVTLRGGVSSVEEAETLNQRIKGPKERSFIQFLRRLYPGSPQSPQARYMAPLEPDLLGEALIEGVLADPNIRQDYLEQVFDGADQSALRTGFTVLSRLSIRRPEEGSEWLRQVLDADVKGRATPAVDACLAVCSESAHAATGVVLERALRREGTPELARDFEERLPEQTVSLREVAVWATEKLLAGMPADPKGEDARNKRAGLLNNLGNRLCDLGRREEALKAADEAVTIRRELARARPDAFLPHLAGSLNNLGIRLSDLGRREEALRAAQESATIHRGLAKARPDAFLPDLAMSLNNLGATLSDLGRHEDALRAAQEAVAIRRELAKARPDAFLPDLAMSLNNVGAMLSALGRREDALKAAQKATDIYRERAKSVPDAFLPDLAGSLNNVGNMLSELGRREEALEATEEAVAIRRRLAKARPDAFLPDLARSLSNIGALLSDLGRNEDSVPYAEEATEIYRELAKVLPDAFVAHLAGSLNNLGLIVSNLGRHKEALRAAGEASEIFRQLAKARPDAFLADLAMSLNNLGGTLSLLGRREEALRAAKEATEIYQGLVKARPEAFLPDLATSLNNLAASLGELDHREEALQAAQEAMVIYRRLARASPDAFLPGLARSLGSWGAYLRAGSRLQDAAEAFRESIRTLEPFFASLPKAHRGLMVGLVKEYLEVSLELGKEPDMELLEPIMDKLQAMKEEDA